MSELLHGLFSSWVLVFVSKVCVFVLKKLPECNWMKKEILALSWADTPVFKSVSVKSYVLLALDITLKHKRRGGDKFNSYEANIMVSLSLDSCKILPQCI